MPINCIAIGSEALVVVRLEVGSSLPRDPTSTCLEDVVSTEIGIYCGEWAGTWVRDSSKTRRACISSPWQAKYGYPVMTRGPTDAAYKTIGVHLAMGCVARSCAQKTPPFWVSLEQRCARVYNA